MPDLHIRDIDEAIFRALKVKAAQEGKTLKQVTTEALATVLYPASTDRLVPRK